MAQKGLMHTTCEFNHVITCNYLYISSFHLTDSIEANVESAEINVQSGVQELSQARDYQVWFVVLHYSYQVILMPLDKATPS
jgi:hypothetical protein